MEFYYWKDYRCAFEQTSGSSRPALVLIHPIGVGLSSKYWHPFVEQWQTSSKVSQPIYNLDLLGCGQSDMPKQAYVPQDWAEQIAHFIETVVSDRVVLVVQGALLPVAVQVMSTRAAQRVAGMVLSGPPDWRLMTTPIARWKQAIAWRLFDSPLGNLFYRYARREQFLRSFSKKQLFEKPEDIDERWLGMLNKGSRNMDSRYAVFSFLAGFWRQDYAARIARIQQPVLVVMGEKASTIDRKTSRQVSQEVEVSEIKPSEAKEKQVTDQTSHKRLQDYMDCFPRAEGVVIRGRNVMPYESTEEFVAAIAPFINNLSGLS